MVKTLQKARRIQGAAEGERQARRGDPVKRFFRRSKLGVLAL